MIERFLDTALLVYTVYIIVTITAPFIIAGAVEGIDWLKIAWGMIKDKNYYKYVAKPVFIFVTFGIIIAFLIALLI